MNMYPKLERSENHLCKNLGKTGSKGGVLLWLTVDLVAVFEFCIHNARYVSYMPFYCQPLHYWLCCCGEFLERGNVRVDGCG